MYGNRFGAADFAALKSLHSVEECAQYLKTHAGYSRTMADADVHGIHRGKLERLLNNQYYIDFTRLSKGLSDKEKQAVILLMRSHETETVLWMYRHLGIEKQERAKYTEKYRLYLSGNCTLDFDALINAEDKEALADAAGGYGEILRRAPDYLVAETELWKRYYAECMEFVSKKLKDRDLLRTLGLRIDLHNIITVFRLREYFDYLAEEIVPFIISPSYRLKDSVITALSAAASKREFFAVLENTPYRFMISDDIEKAADGYTVANACKTLHFSKSAPAVIYAYTEYKRSEIQKIKTAVETVRYNLNGEMI